MTVPVTWVDAFTDRAFGGNPAAVCLTDEPLADERMQALATELGLAETAYLVPLGGDRHWSLRWFTPVTEVDLCGHATLASAHALLGWGRLADGEVARFETRSGELTATVGGGRIELDLPAAAPEPVAVPAELGGWPPGALGFFRGGFLLVEMPDEASVRDLAPDLVALRRLPDHGVVVTAPGGDGETDYVLRMFAPTMGIDEDPVTGSAACTAGPFWAARLGTDVLRAAQLSARGGRLLVTCAGDRVRIAGHAVTVLVGEVALW